MAEMSDELTAAYMMGVHSAPRWIPVEERLPDHGGSVVCRTKGRELQFGRVMTVTEYKDGEKTVTKHWRGYPDCPLEVTHWTPLPGPPADFEQPGNAKDQRLATAGECHEQRL